MVNKTDATSLFYFARTLMLVLLALGLTRSAEVFGQTAEEEHLEAIRSSTQASQQRQSPELSEVGKLIIQKTNVFRQEQKLEKVDANAKLMETAQYFAGYMAKNNRYGHTADGKRPADRAKNHDYDYCLVSENIAYEFSSEGFETSQLAEKLVEGWKHSPEHRKNMLDSAATETGVAVAQSPDTGYFYAVQMFGRPKSQSIDFEVENQSSTAIEYQIGNRTFPLPPTYTRTHQQCRPSEIIFRWPEDAQGKTATIQAQDGDRFVIIEQAGELKVNKE